jgi:hypothetical protein
LKCIKMAMIKMTIFKDIIWKGQDNNVKWKK